MAKQQTRYSDFVTEWEHLLNTLAGSAGDLPHLETSRAKLQGFLDEVRSLAMQQDLHTANKQLASQQLKVALASGKKLATFLRTGLKEHYGNRNEKLVEFGIPPFRRRKKVPAAPQPPEVQPPPTGPSTGPTTSPAPKPVG
ncbi:MAG TPA: hypothetical protein VGH73_25710 [Thermoanaerobaculia bacterium]|jgi:hypothetical protein